MTAFTHDFDGERLTVTQIMERTGLCRTTARKMARQGVCTSLQARERYAASPTARIVSNRVWRLTGGRVAPPTARATLYVKP